ncbi:ubiquitin carboxyl-terminal hydrolase 48-like [Amphibalanus amphitrite]|uniref:ubiquitin carboxyl-terminal hydrolase 48-like n=1 Tax=Amphibalanus amphitrite TaxID=1232801 RepID=UPI001C90ABEC|nr:ubiquitin carboxyl-terminal hydrolase 48-like [Amphibalanus amphitrite]XP_043234940.1 ubiquitin carboxyl-terminal hydrolase 48-like [Amphibalanus amphitrite]XP_043234941.1 ubiquitin carboxyl-terminal hydrolase 48-like [Amphibalanus amphitrite]
MPPRKDQVERQAWQWAETTPPEDVTEEHVLTAYILQPPHSRKTACKKNCRHQPLCIAGLGEHDWLYNSDETRLYAGDREEPDVRTAQVPAGLKNLGATCYVNSLLQLWFHNRKFRRAILQWDPVADPVEQLNETLLTSQYSPLTPIGHLQLIFGYMHGGMLRTVDPSPFILSLRLDTMYQQDAQEFSKLFSTLLEEALSHQSRPEVSGAVQHLMRGQYEYVTRCNECLQESTCPSYFYELDLQIQGQKQLSDCLTEFLREESLTGANQYNCQTCQCKRDASRAIRLTQLPPVLNFQLMRFVFDRETGLKKKLSSHLRFPELLDVSEFVGRPSGAVTYRLQAVLLHKGPSAYSGHYTAHICDSETGAWFRFNDEEVEKIKSLKLNAEDDLEDSAAKKPKQTRCPKGYHSSNQAYMLVYYRVPETAETNGPTASQADGKPAKAEGRQAKVEAKAKADSKAKLKAEAEITLPDHIQTMVEAMNATVNDQVQLNEQAKSVSVEEYRTREREVREIYPRLTCSDVRAGLLLLPAAWLSAWLAGDTPGPVDPASLLCHHGKLSPWHAAKMKCVDPGAGSLLTCLYGGAGLDRSGLCRDCVQSRCRAIRARQQLEEDARTVTTLLKEDLKPDDPAVWVGKTTLRVWKRLALQSLPQDSPPSAPTGGGDTPSSVPGTAPAAAVTTTASSAPATVTSAPETDSNTPTDQTTTNGTGQPSRKRPASSVEDAGDSSPKRTPGRRASAAEDRTVRVGLSEDTAVEMAVDRAGEVEEEESGLGRTNGNVGDEGKVKSLSEAVEGRCKSVLSAEKKDALASEVTESSALDVKEEKNSDETIPAESKNVSTDKEEAPTNGAVPSSMETEPAETSPDPANRSPSPSASSSTSQPASTAASLASTCASTPATTPTPSAASTCASTSAAAGSSAPRRSSVSRSNGHPETDSEGTARGRPGAETEDTSGPEDDEDDEEEEFNGDLRCAHGELCVEEGVRRLVPLSVWSILVKYFPDAPEYGRDRQLCQQCREQVSEEEQMRQLYRQMATEQRAAISDLYSDRLRPQVAAPSCPPGRYHALGRQSTELWRKFLKDPLRRDPANLETRSLLCRHGGLVFSPTDPEDRHRMVFLHDWEWDIVKRSGHDGCEVIITRTEGDPTLATHPAPCEECIQSRRTEEQQRQLQYASTKIFIRKVDSLEDEMEELASKRPRLEGAPEPVRRSSRPRRAPGSKPLSVASTDTLRDLKVQIMKAFKVAPYDQHLMFNGVPLLDGLSTLGHLGIVPGSTLLLKVDEASESVDLTSSEDLTAAANPEMGFKGTGLVSS